jgi:transglutaminase-like putative cysteine protease
LPGNQSLETTLWTDTAGEVIKSHMAALQQESFRTTKQIALAPAGKAGSFDLGLDLFVKVDPPLKNPQQTREVVYRVELTDGDPSQVFASGPTQSVKPLGPHVAEITVRSIRPGDPNDSPAAEAPRAEYSAANSVLQIDDTEIRKMAAEARGDAKTPAELAVALEKYVHGAVNEKNFSHGFATAAEVAQSRAGDCTEHAVLLAALARVVGLPSRVAIGLVYVERAGGFGYHMWTEVFLDGRWVPLDAILGAGGTSAAYLKLTDSSLEGASAYSSFLSVAQVLGQLKISVVSQN